MDRICEWVYVLDKDSVKQTRAFYEKLTKIDCSADADFLLVTGARRFVNFIGTATPLSGHEREFYCQGTVLYFIVPQGHPNIYKFFEKTHPYLTFKEENLVKLSGYGTKCPGGVAHDNN